MGKKYWLIIHQTSIHRFCLLLICLAMPQQILAIPKSIARIVCIFEGKNKPIQKPKKVLADGKSSENTSLDPNKANVLLTDSNENKKEPAPPPILSNAQQARLAIDVAMKDPKLVGHPATWYYRGVIYDRLLRDHIASAEAPTLLKETIAAYTQAKKLSLPKTQFHSFALSNLAALWHYFLHRGISYYKQESVDQSLEQFTICQRILPQETTPLLYSAIVYHGSDQPEEALRSYEAYIKLQGPHFAVCRAMADIYYHKLKNFDKAIAILDEALLQFPFNNDLLEEKCLIYQAAGRIDDYMATLAVGLQNKEVNALYAYAYLLEYQGRMQEAVGYYKQVLTDDPRQYDTLRQMGFLFYNEAIKLYADALKAVGQGDQLDSDTLTDCFRIIHVKATPSLPHSVGYLSSSILLSIRSRGAFLPKEPLRSAAPKWIVYNHPLVKDKQIKYLSCLLQAGKIPCTSLLYGYMYQKMAAIMNHNRWIQTMVALEKYLKQSLDYLKIARAQDKKDKQLAQALYYNYYHLKKYRSAYSLLQAMQKQKQYLEDDPFLDNQLKE
ncbi:MULTISPECIES: lipopolysaccharide assembly protein LapB [unclassified Candidatus Cardinium]|uniref:tetratricopeptide repeat protein n=1 Tax=unclassified Candidatus Cardinium TaxID=2641185 RepID=UPI001FB25A33|nr:MULTISPECIES: hypothetical protein [unclassified Candidatus Cardinium]